VISEHTEEQASLYVLGMLDAEEARQFEVEMASDPELADLVRRAERGAAALAWTVPRRKPPQAVRRRLITAIQREPKPVPRAETPIETAFNWFPWALAACLAIVVCGFGYKRYQNRLVIADFIIKEHNQQAALDHEQRREVALQNQLRTADHENASLLAELGQTRAQITDLTNRNALASVKIAMLASMAKNAPDARAVVAWDGNSQQGILKTLGMPAAAADQDYQLWVIDPDYKTPVSAGVFDPAAGAKFAPVHRIMKADKFAVSLEKKGGSETPQGPIVMVSE
jgi:anti-sigma-K factor RskA